MQNAFNGQYVWVFCQNSYSNKTFSFNSYLEELLTDVDHYRNNEERLFSMMNEFLDARHKAGEIAIWGGAGKGNIYLNLFDKERNRIRYLIDSDKTKQGWFTSGTGHKIYSPEDALSDKSLKTIIIMNEKYEDEIKAVLNGRDSLIITADGFCRENMISNAKD